MRPARFQVLPQAMKVDAAIDLIIPDNTAFTVLTALRQLGYEELTRVERSEHVILTVADTARPDDVVQQLARAEVLFNPNKHRMAYSVEEAAPAAQPPEFEARVRDADEDTSRLCALLTATFGMTSLRGVERAVGWRLYETSGPAPREQLEWACRELLANTVSQRYDIRPRPVRVQVREPGGLAAKEHR